MKLVRFLWQEEVCYGVMEREEIHALSGEIFGDCGPGPRLCGLGMMQQLDALPEA
jgi:hypothetical protein